MDRIYYCLGAKVKIIYQKEFNDDILKVQDPKKLFNKGADEISSLFLDCGPVSSRHRRFPEICVILDFSSSAKVEVNDNELK